MIISVTFNSEISFISQGITGKTSLWEIRTCIKPAVAGSDNSVKQNADCDFNHFCEVSPWKEIRVVIEIQDKSSFMDMYLTPIMAIATTDSSVD